MFKRNFARKLVYVLKWIHSFQARVLTNVEKQKSKEMLKVERYRLHFYAILHNFHLYPRNLVLDEEHSFT